MNQLMNHDQPYDSDGVDQQIRDALQTEPSPLQLARLERFWQQQQSADRRRRVRRTLAVAASLAIAASALSGWWPEQSVLVVEQQVVERQEPAALVVSPEIPPTPPEIPPTVVAAQPSSEPSKRKFGRPPTDYERLMFAMRTGKPAPRQATFDSDAFDVAIGQLSLDFNEGEGRLKGSEQLARLVTQAPNHANRAELMRRLLQSDEELQLRGFLSFVERDYLRGEALAVAKQLPRLPVDRLLALLEDPSQAVRLSAARVLGHVNGVEITRSLISLVTEQSPENVEAWMALLVCRGELADEFKAYAAVRPKLLVHVNLAHSRLLRMSYGSM